MKKIVYNYDNLNEENINRFVKRAKIILVNDNDEVLLCNCNNDYHFVGGHGCDNESDLECLQREILEEVGVDIKIPYLEPIISIEYFNKDYPSSSVNTKSVANYYFLKVNIVPNYDSIRLTKEEEEGGFYFKYVKASEVMVTLLNSLDKATRLNVVYDTIDAFLEYMKLNLI